MSDAGGLHDFCSQIIRSVSGLRHRRSLARSLACVIIIVYCCLYVFCYHAFIITSLALLHSCTLALLRSCTLVCMNLCMLCVFIYVCMTSKANVVRVYQVYVSHEITITNFLQNTFSDGKEGISSRMFDRNPRYGLKMHTLSACMPRNMKCEQHSAQLPPFHSDRCSI